MVGRSLKNGFGSVHRLLTGLNMSEYILETEKLSKDFSGFVAVDNVSLRVRTNSIHALIGPNGAGKTTFFHLLTKFHRPTSGVIKYKGESIVALAPEKIARKGIIRSFQISAVFPYMTVLDNVLAGLQRKAGLTYHFLSSRQKASFLESKARELLSQVGLLDYASEYAVELPYGYKRALELATTLGMDPELMLLDEPTQGMGIEDVSRVTKLIKEVSEGRTILMVEHNMNVVSEIADEITVLTRGQILANGTYEEISKNPDVLEAYMGTTAQDNSESS